MQEPSLSGKHNDEKKTHQAFAQALRLDESFLEAVGLAIFTTTPLGTITAFNSPAVSLLGYSSGEVIGKHTPLIFHDPRELTTRSGDQKPDFEVMVEEALQNRSVRNEWTLVRKDGSRFHGSVTIMAMKDDDGNVTGYAGIIRDESTQHRLKEEVEISEERFRLLAENIPGVIYLCYNDRDFTTIYVNDHIQTLTGYPKENFLSGKISFEALFHPDDAKRVHESITAAVNDRKSYHLRYRLRQIGGAYRWVDEWGVGVYEGDKLVMLEGFIQDVTVQKAAEEELKKTSDENLRFFNNPVNLNAVADFSSTLIRISPSWAKVLGWSDEELKSRPIFEFIHPDDVHDTREQLNNLERARHVHTFENRVTCKDGSYRWLLWALAPDFGRQLVYVSAIDITERRRSEETILDSKSNLEVITLQLQEQNRKLDEFAHIISHNLRAPVNNIQALINLLDEKSEIADYKLIFDKLKNVSKNLSETMNELMDTLKAKTQPEVDLTEIRFKEVLDKVVQSLEGELIVAQASVTFDFNAAPTIRYSKPYLESIFQNLLTNAVKYKSPSRNPAIHFRSQYTDGHLQLEVSDNGQGIDMEKFGDKLFGLHKTFHEHREARGVGLFLVKTQIEALGGSIRVNSAVDKGTTFTIRFN